MSDNELLWDDYKTTRSEERQKITYATRTK